jgi:hypothetical protein
LQMALKFVIINLGKNKNSRER